MPTFNAHSEVHPITHLTFFCYRVGRSHTAATLSLPLVPQHHTGRERTTDQELVAHVSIEIIVDQIKKFATGKARCSSRTKRCIVT